MASYGIAGNGDGTYDLEFVVEDGVSVDYIYDGDRDVYEIHLTEDDNATQADFIQTFTKEEGVALNIEFVNDSWINPHQMKESQNYSRTNKYLEQIHI